MNLNAFQDTQQCFIKVYKVLFHFSKKKVDCCRKYDETPKINVCFPNNSLDTTSDDPSKLFSVSCPLVTNSVHDHFFVLLK